MNRIISLLAAAASWNICAGNPAGIALPQDASLDVLPVPLSLDNRALPNSPSGGYAPGAVDCPSTRPTIRAASSLSAAESSWLERRRNNTVGPLSSWLSRMNISDFDAAAYINTHKNNATALPNIGIAFSGGGYRALMNGAGFLAAADARTSNATNTGQIGGLLQATTYLAGLSGGSWLVGSVYTNNFSSVEALRDGHNDSSIWKFGNSIFEGPATGKFKVLSSLSYFESIESQVSAKADSPLGFNTSITDYWGRALSYQLVDAPEGGPAYTFSSIALTDDFKNGDIPFPLIVADERAHDTKIVSINSTVYEFNPFEMGSWDPALYAFAPTEYLGSNFSGGSVPDGQKCVRGFDQAGFVMGTSSTLFNQFILQINSSAAAGVPTFLRDIFTKILLRVGDANDDIAQYQPNPFYSFNNATNRNSQSKELTLVDGGEDNQNIPLNPLIQPNRNVDVIFAIDSSADTYYTWPNGSSLVWTYRRSLNATIENGTAFPAIPDHNTFVNLGLNTHPTFFGCNASNMTGPAPLIVYIPNAPYIYNSNVSTFDPSYNNTERNAIIENGYDVATMGNGTLDREWPTCMACAVLSRSFTKTGTAVPAACQTCFTRYCWNGQLDSKEPSGNYTPPYKLSELKISSAAPAAVTVMKTSAYISALAAAVANVLV
ncbi:Lysophospholipase [Venustampulla echinocandica]|uniref:Lysophospholipase n=1 Tax=Venustampulla echinocandica TaxID=2656787 RepID=A0A370TAQ1_9HELO|nr:Lysophospholipase [Venustampulla echinocandica]RDL31013.1 Lysophospholipase [Venustampulla echinocandica]